MNVFQAHSHIITDYSSYIRSFINIADPKIHNIVEQELNKGKLWPETIVTVQSFF
jgi:hypothetical protein